ncbi:hypothetical protein BDZ90DRAFT_232283 [Jaminaea rosea]|uniref:Uncharacterized protein n=1 Tax=Jaminaea rosea TaxID=1569628 RepID=A0A316UR85_9BASI|nr:hypothetical protein BDZ90DRAFT_232283 [Jaminaea rosea]PWN27298.1 hypothetical protein BDZ90DRAFT_232283 [Jaminaea rosea]
MRADFLALFPALLTLTATTIIAMPAGINELMGRSQIEPLCADCACSYTWCHGCPGCHHTERMFEVESELAE